MITTVGQLVLELQKHSPDKEVQIKRGEGTRQVVSVTEHLKGAKGESSEQIVSIEC